MNSLVCILSCLLAGAAMGHPQPQLEWFYNFFKQCGSGQFSQQTFNRPSPPSRSAPSPQFQAPSSLNTNVDSGKSFPTAAPYVHDPSGDGPAARQQQAATKRAEDTSLPIRTNPVTNTDVVDPKSHEAALQ